jgi:hypothetical protein
MTRIVVLYRQKAIAMSILWVKKITTVNCQLRLQIVIRGRGSIGKLKGIIERCGIFNNCILNIQI